MQSWFLKGFIFFCVKVFLTCKTREMTDKLLYVYMICYILMQKLAYYTGSNNSLKMTTIYFMKWRACHCILNTLATC